MKNKSNIIDSLILNHSPVYTLNLSQKRTVKLTALASAIPGAGQLINKQYVKGVFYLVLFGIFAALFPTFIIKSIAGLFSLGTVPVRDHSLFFMVYGIIALILLAVFAVFYVTNIIDAYKSRLAMFSPNYNRITFKEDYLEERKKAYRSRFAFGKKNDVAVQPSKFEAFVAVLFKHIARTTDKKAPFFYMLPGVIAVIIVVVVPLIFSILIGFTNYDSNNMPPRVILEWVGFKNFWTIFSNPLYGTALKNVIIWSIIWTILSSIFPYILGIGLALLLSQKKLPGKKIFKAIYILPWAIPAYISAMVLQTMFDPSFGLINLTLDTLRLPTVEWLNNVTAARASVIIVATWLSFSFPMMLSDSIIAAIPKELYEAAKLDGAGTVRQFTSITFPLLMFSISPMFLLSFSGAFSNFNVIYIVTGGYPMEPGMFSVGAGKTDILISWLYKMTAQTNKFNYASAISLIIFVFIAIFSIFNLRRTKSFKEEDMLK